MQHIHKQIIVMFFSVLFMATVGIIVLSATATAGYVDPYTSASIRDSNLRTADSVLSGDYYQEPTYNNPSSSGYPNDIFPSQYDRDMERMVERKIEDAQRERDYSRPYYPSDAELATLSDIDRKLYHQLTDTDHNQPTTRPQPTNHQPLNLDWGFDGVIGAVVLLIIGVMVIFTIFAYFNSKVTYKTDTDMADEYASRTAHAATEIQCEYMDIPDWINELDEHDRRAVLEEIEREFKR